MIKIAILISVFSGILIMIGNKTDVFTFLGGSQIKNEDATARELKIPVITITKKWEMPKQLLEISDLSYVDDKRIACVQDELGTVFIYNIASSSVEKEIPFGAVGDYEGLAMVGETVWVLRSDGKLFEVNNINAAKPMVKEYKTQLTIKQDSEGLCRQRTHRGGACQFKKTNCQQP